MCFYRFNKSHKKKEKLLISKEDAFLYKKNLEVVNYTKLHENNKAILFYSNFAKKVQNRS